MTREQIEAIPALWTKYTTYPASTIRALCELALEGLELRAENERLRFALQDIAAHEVSTPNSGNHNDLIAQASISRARAALKRKPE